MQLKFFLCEVCHPIRHLIWKYRIMIHKVLICHLSIIFLLAAPKLSYSIVFQKTFKDPSFSPASPLGNNLHIYLNPCRSPTESNTSSVTYLCMTSDQKNLSFVTQGFHLWKDNALPYSHTVLRIKWKVCKSCFNYNVLYVSIIIFLSDKQQLCPRPKLENTVIDILFSILLVYG